MKINLTTLLVLGAVGVGGYLYMKNKNTQGQSEVMDDGLGGGGFGGGGSTTATPVTSTAPVVVVPTTQEVKPKPQMMPQYKPNTPVINLGTGKPVMPPVASKPTSPAIPVSKFVNFFDGEEIIENNPNMFFEGNID